MLKTITNSCSFPCMVTTDMLDAACICILIIVLHSWWKGWKNTKNLYMAYFDKIVRKQSHRREHAKWIEYNIAQLIPGYQRKGTYAGCFRRIFSCFNSPPSCLLEFHLKSSLVFRCSCLNKTLHYSLEKKDLIDISRKTH